MNTQSNQGSKAHKRRSHVASMTFEPQGQRATSSEHEPHMPLTDMTKFFSTASYMPQHQQKQPTATSNHLGRKSSLRSGTAMPPRC